MASNSKRIAKNTMFLYFRMFLIMGLSLYTSRIILKTLGIEDFGIYNVVGGVVTMFSFLSGCLGSATSRFITFELGKKDYSKLQTTFNAALLVHIIIGVFIVILAETIGLWFFYEKMTIPADRVAAAFLVVIEICTLFSSYLSIQKGESGKFDILVAIIMTLIAIMFIRVPHSEEEEVHKMMGELDQSNQE